MSAHTPGPWDLELDAMAEGDIGVFGTGMVPIAIVDVRDFPDDDTSLPRETALANGHLMAAAPDLLAALRDLYDRGVLKGPAELVEQEVHAAIVAIAKAEGR